MSLSPEELDTLRQLYQTAQEAFAAGGWLALLPFIPMALVNLYKMPFVQGIIEAKLPQLSWSRLTPWGQAVVAFLIGSTPVFLTNVMAHMSVGAAAMLAVSSGVAAIFGHKFAFKPLARTQMVTDAMASMPPSVSKSLSLVVPYDAKRVAEARAEAAK